MSLWDLQQREWLQAMGHSPLVLVGDEAVGGEPVGDAAVDSLGRHPRESGDPGPHRDHAPSLDPRPPTQAFEGRLRGDDGRKAAAIDSPPTPPRTSVADKAAALATARRAGASRDSGPLGEALKRATGQQPAGAARILRNLEIDQAALRDDPAAKRALWTRLRQLRKAARK